MNYKIGDKVTLAPTTPLIITNILAGSTRIEVKSPSNDICFWTSPDHLTPTLRPESTSIPPHKSPSIGDLIVTKPTAHTIYDAPVGNRIGRIRGICYESTTYKCYDIEWSYDLTTQSFINPPNSRNVVEPDQFV